MSYYIYVRAENCCEGHGHNVTANFSVLFRALHLDAIFFAQPPVPEGAIRPRPLRALAALPLLIEAIRRIDYDAGIGDLDQHVKGNGDWGTLQQARAVLWDVALDCARHPDAEVGR